MRVTITSDVARVEARLAALGDAMPVATGRAVQATAEAIAHIVVPAIRQATPVRSGKLAASTRSTIDIRGPNATITVRQPALSARNQNGSGGGFPYVVAVIKGRKAIAVPPSGEFPSGAKALMTPWGPRKSVKAAPGHDYISPAIDATQPEIQAALDASTVLVRASIATVLK